jgi:hypothetical protein
MSETHKNRGVLVAKSCEAQRHGQRAILLCFSPNRPFYYGEIAQARDGRLGMAHTVSAEGM